MRLSRRELVAGAGAVAIAGEASATAVIARQWPKAEDARLVWAPVASLPRPAQEIYAATPTRTFIAGGLAGREGAPFAVLDAFTAYQPFEDRWADAMPLPFARHHPALGVANGLWIVGGFRESGAGHWTAITDVLRADDGTWAPGPPLARPQCEAVTLGHGRRLHVIGGRSPRGTANGRWSDHGDIADHRVLDATNGASGARWTTARPAPTARNSAAGAEIEGRLYVVGGRTVAGGNLATLERYDPRTDSWETLRPMPQASGGLAAASQGGRLYVFGGEYFNDAGGGVHAQTWIYDPAEDSWAAGPDMRTPRHGLAGATNFGRNGGLAIYAIGGATRAGANGTSAVVEMLAPA